MKEMLVVGNALRLFTAKYREKFMKVSEHKQRPYYARSNSAQSFASASEPPADLFGSPSTETTSSLLISDHISHQYTTMTALIQDVVRSTVASVSRYFASDTTAMKKPAPYILSTSTRSSVSEPGEKHAEMSERGLHVQKAAEYIRQGDFMNVQHEGPAMLKSYKIALQHAKNGKDLRLQSQAHERIARHGRILCETNIVDYAALRKHADGAKDLALPGSNEYYQANETRTSLD
jgi:hypothetical protein